VVVRPFCGSCLCVGVFVCACERVLVCACTHMHTVFLIYT
jgi:hypothetical protein